jgi:hypothetical protein
MGNVATTSGGDPVVSLNFIDATKLGTARAREPNLKKTGESSTSHSSNILFTHFCRSHFA